MPHKIVITGAGFAGVWSALSAKRLAGLANKKNELHVLVIAPQPFLIMRPRLYEANPSIMSHPLGSLFKAAGIDYFQGTAEKIDTSARAVRVRSSEGIEATIDYDRLILAAGSSVVRPHGISGIEQHAFDVDSLSSATELEAHLKNLASLPASPARSTVVVCGGGFTGIEVATELPKRLRHIPNPRIILIENANEVGPGLGSGPRPTITEALNELGIEVKLGSAVAAIDADSVTLTSGERIETKTAIWTAGVRATPLTQQIPGERDPLCRLRVDQTLRVPSAPDVFATGDAACASADDKGHIALMSCQHALQLGRVSGHNAAADLLGEPLVEYVQTAYNCCLDLGTWGAIFARGWEREVSLTGDLGKRVKCHINQTLIYPPEDVQQALEWANPIGADSEDLTQQTLEVVA